MVKMFLSGDHESMYRVQVYVPGRQDCLVHDPVFWSAYLSVAPLTSPLHLVENNRMSNEITGYPP